jgi:hypothetical protein
MLSSRFLNIIESMMKIANTLGVLSIHFKKGTFFVKWTRSSRVNLSLYSVFIVYSLVRTIQSKVNGTSRQFQASYAIFLAGFLNVLALIVFIIRSDETTHALNQYIRWVHKFQSTSYKCLRAFIYSLIITHMSHIIIH